MKKKLQEYVSWGGAKNHGNLSRRQATRRGWPEASGRPGLGTLIRKARKKAVWTWQGQGGPGNPQLSHEAPERKGPGSAGSTQVLETQKDSYGNLAKTVPRLARPAARQKKERMG